MREANQTDIARLGNVLKNKFSQEEFDKELYQILKDINPDYYTLGFSVVTCDDVLRKPMFIDGKLTVASRNKHRRIPVGKLNAQEQMDIRIQLHNVMNMNFINFM